MAGQIVNRAGLANVCGKSLPTIDAWVSKGCPFLARGSKGVDWQFNTADVFAWCVAQASANAEKSAPDGGLDPAQERARKDRALAISAELKNEITRGEVVRIDDVLDPIVQQFGIVRQRVLAMPGRVGMTLPEDIRDQVRSAIEREAHDALTELSEDRVAEEAKVPPKARRRR